MFIAYNRKKTKAYLICTKARSGDFLADVVFWHLPKAKTNGEEIYHNGVYTGFITDVISLEKILEYAEHYNIECEEIALVTEVASTRITTKYVTTNGWTI